MRNHSENRITPRWEFFGGPAFPPAVLLNRMSEEYDRELLRETIIYTVRQKKKKVLLCAEQIPEMSLLEPLFRSLPEDVGATCVTLPEFWNPAEALGVYRQSAAVFGMEMHSQVMALGNGIPAAVFRHNGFGSKSTMWRDLGIPEWLREIDSPECTAQAFAFIDDLLSPAAQEKVRQCRKKIDRDAECDLVRRGFTLLVKDLQNRMAFATI